MSQSSSAGCGAIKVLWFLTLVLTASLALAESKPVVGAIRWDAWHGDRSEVGKAVERSLGPERWHGRLPFFSRVIGPDAVQIDGASRQVMDREIRFAHQARLDYWAFLLYDVGSAMNHGLEHYLASRDKRGLRFCLIVEQTRLTNPDVAAKWGERIAMLARRPEYLAVAGARSLLYLLTAEVSPRESIGQIRTAFRKAGLADPYVVILNPQVARGHAQQVESGADAISAYAYQKGGAGAPYSQLAGDAEQFWKDCLATGSDVVPIVMSGWDRRPRVEHPVPWERWQTPRAGIDKFYAPPTPAELTDHVRAAVRWTSDHRTGSQAILIYAWNENDEGGWLVPTLKDGTWRIQAVRKALSP
jgi:hypothetical protein